MSEMSQHARTEVLELMEQKDKLENEIELLTAILKQNGVGMAEPLVDNEGFPLNNVDIYQVRNARHRIICLQNDHKAIMKKIENGLQGYYSFSKLDTASTAGDSSNDAAMDVEPIRIVTHKIPFCKVSYLAEGSPAAYAGFSREDEIVEFGSVNTSNFKNITDIATVVQHSENSPINVKLKRGERYITTQLIPKKWNGKGLLGCTVVPINN